MRTYGRLVRMREKRREEKTEVNPTKDNRAIFTGARSIFISCHRPWPSWCRGTSSYGACAPCAACASWCRGRQYRAAKKKYWEF